MTQPKDGRLQPDLCTSGGSPQSRNSEGGPLHSAHGVPELTLKWPLRSPFSRLAPPASLHPGPCWEPQVGGQEVRGTLFLKDTDGATPPLGAPLPQRSALPCTLKAQPHMPGIQAPRSPPLNPVTDSPFCGPTSRVRLRTDPSRGKPVLCFPRPHSVSLSSELPTWAGHAPKVGHGLGPGSHCRGPLGHTLRICYPQLRYL